jgi:hypothetical protein
MILISHAKEMQEAISLVNRSSASRPNIGHSRYSLTASEARFPMQLDSRPLSVNVPSSDLVFTNIGKVEDAGLPKSRPLPRRGPCRYGPLPNLLLSDGENL